MCKKSRFLNNNNNNTNNTLNNNNSFAESNFAVQSYFWMKEADRKRFGKNFAFEHFLQLSREKDEKIPSVHSRRIAPYSHLVFMDSGTQSCRENLPPPPPVQKVSIVEFNIEIQEPILPNVFSLLTKNISVFR